MSYRSIDFQLSVSRLPEKSVTHNQALQKPVTDQTLAADSAIKHDAHARIRNEAAEKPAKSSIRKGGEQQGKGGRGKKQKQPSDAPFDLQDEERGNSDGHPYKGKRIDLSL